MQLCDKTQERNRHMLVRNMSVPDSSTLKCKRCRETRITHQRNLVALGLYCSTHSLQGYSLSVQGDPCWSAVMCLSVTADQVTFSGCAAPLSEDILSAGWTWQMHLAHRPSQLKWCGSIQTQILKQRRATLPRHLIHEINICVEGVSQFRPVFSSLLSQVK